MENAAQNSGAVLQRVVAVSQPTSEEERVAVFQNYIYQGGQLISGGRFGEAIAHFRNRQAAEQAGLKFSPSRERLAAAVSPEDVETFANVAAMNSWFLPEQRRINSSGVSVAGRNLQELPPEQMSPAERQLAHELALVHMEEFLHGLQFLRGRPLTEFTDQEIDVAAYMHKNGIPLTAAFLRRYDRGLMILGDEGSDDSLTARPALRRGTFVRIGRSDGQVDPDWQIAGFDSQTGNAIIRRFVPDRATLDRLAPQAEPGSYLEKKVPQRELADLNEQGVYPFAACADFPQLFSQIDRLGKIQGTSDIFEAGNLKVMINVVRQDSRRIVDIPRSGGLRLRVAELLKVNPQLRNATAQMRS